MFSKLSDVKTMDFISEDLKTNKVIIASHITMNSLFFWKASSKTVQYA